MLTNDVVSFEQLGLVCLHVLRWMDTSQMQNPVWQIEPFFLFSLSLSFFPVGGYS